MQRRIIVVTNLLGLTILLAIGGQVFAATAATTVTFPNSLDATITQHAKTEITAVVPNSVSMVICHQYRHWNQ